MSALFQLRHILYAAPSYSCPHLLPPRVELFGIDGTAIFQGRDICDIRVKETLPKRTGTDRLIWLEPVSGGVL